MSSVEFALGLCACICILCLVGHASAAAGVYWTKSYPLQQGQAVVHQVQVDNSALFSLTSPPGAQFALYAIQIQRAGAQYCPPEAAIRSMASYVSPRSLVLPRGQWCIAVYAGMGSGTYFLEASSIGQIPPPPIPMSNNNPSAPPIPMSQNYPPAIQQTPPVTAGPPFAGLTGFTGFSSQQIVTFNQNFFSLPMNR